MGSPIIKSKGYGIFATLFLIPKNQIPTACPTYKNKQVFIKGYGLGPYNRILGVVYVGKKNVNLELVKAGLVEVYQGKPPRGFDLSPYLTAEAQAKSQRRGMWSQENYISPKDWQKLHK